MAVDIKLEVKVLTIVFITGVKLKIIYARLEQMYIHVGNCKN